MPRVLGCRRWSIALATALLLLAGAAGAAASAQTGTYTGRTSERSAHFAARVQIAVKNAVVQPSSFLAWSANCTGRLKKIVDTTNFAGPVRSGRFAGKGVEREHVGGYVRKNHISLRIVFHGLSATGTFADRTTVLRRTPIARCVTKVHFTARLEAPVT